MRACEAAIRSDKFCGDMQPLPLVGRGGERSEPGWGCRRRDEHDDASKCDHNADHVEQAQTTAARVRPMPSASCGMYCAR